MPPDPAGPPDPPDLRAELAAERAAVEHWRRLALQRSAEYASVTGRPTVRALLGVERRLEPLRARGRSARRHLRSAVERVALGAAALRRAGRRPVSPPASAPGAAPGLAPARRLAVVVVGTEAPGWSGSPPAGVEVTRVVEPAGARAAIAAAIAASAPDLVGVVAATSQPVHPAWLHHLAAAVEGTAVAAVPLAVHPRRPLRRATPHDGLVRAAGVGLRLDDEGAPLAVALGAGSRPRPDGPVTDVHAGTAAGLVVDRTAYQAAGGLSSTDDLDAAVAELCAHLLARRGRVVVAPAALVVDDRPVRTRRDLRFAVDPAGPGWAAAVRRSGAVLRRAADPRPRPPLRVAVTTAALSARMAPRWGDWHVAQALADSLRRLGVEVRLQTADRSEALAGRACDVHLVLRGLRQVRRTPGQRHVLWIISHPETVGDDELAEADLVLVASPRFAEHLRSRTDTPVEVLLQATDHRRFAPQPIDPAHGHDLTIVAKTRDVLRPAVADALAAGLRPHIYGGGWRGLVDEDLIVADHVDNAGLPAVYSSAGVVLNDHWGTMRAWGFVSNRLFDVLACGTPVISDPVEGLDGLFQGAVPVYRSPTELRALVDEVLADPAAARRRAARGRAVVVADHTFDRRAHQLLDALAEQGLVPDPLGGEDVLGIGPGAGHGGSDGRAETGPAPLRTGGPRRGFVYSARRRLRRGVRCRT